MNLKRALVIALVFICWSGGPLKAQNVDFKTANFKDKKEELKVIVEKMAKAELILEEANESIAKVRDPGNKFEEVLFIYKEAYAFNPNNAELNMKMGNCLLYTNEKYEAKKYLEKSLNVDPNNKKTCEGYGNLLLKLNQHGKAIAYLRKGTGLIKFTQKDFEII